MTVLDQFYRCRSIRLGPVDYTLVEPPTILGVPLFPPGSRYQAPARCVTKRAWSLDVSVEIQGLTIPLEGIPLGVDRRGRTLVRWKAPGDIGRWVGPVFIQSAKGHLIGELVEVPLVEQPDCANLPGHFFVEIRFLPEQARDDSFGTPPSDVPADSFRIGITGMTDAVAQVTGFSGLAGIPAPPPQPWPRPLRIVMPGCVSSAITNPRISGRVELSGTPGREHAGFGLNFRVESLEDEDSPRLLDPPRVVGEGNPVNFELALPAGLTGRVRVTVDTGAGEPAGSQTFSVAGGRFGCRGIDFDLYIGVLLGCEPIDCGWIGLNDLGTLAGFQGDDAVIRLLGRTQPQRVGAGVDGKARIRALNNRNQVAGTIDRGDGRAIGFVEGPDASGAPRLRLAEGVTFTALNDSSVGTGLLETVQGPVPMLWRDGEIEPLHFPAAGAIPLAIDGAGNLAGIWTEADGNGLRAFSFTAGAFRDLGDLPGEAIGLQLNGAGAVAVTVAKPEGLRGLLLTAEGRTEIPLPDDADGLAIAGINEQGIAAVTVRSRGRSRPARFVPERGLDYLDELTGSKAPASGEAVAINNLGQILVAAAGEDGPPGYMLLTPAALPIPGEASHACTGCARAGAPAQSAPAGPEGPRGLVLLLVLILLLLVALLALTV